MTAGLLCPAGIGVADRMPPVPVSDSADASPAMAVAQLQRAAQAGHTAPVVIRRHKPLFFGYLEYDFDPDAPGGVPGFGPLPRLP